MARRKLVNGVIVDLTQDEEDWYDANHIIKQEARDRRDKKQEIRAEALARVQAVLPQVDSFEEVLMLKSIYAAFTPTTEGALAKDIYLYAKTKLDQADTAPIAEVRAYDPTTDTGWPT